MKRVFGIVAFLPSIAASEGSLADSRGDSEQQTSGNASSSRCEKSNASSSMSHQNQSSRHEGLFSFEEKQARSPNRDRFRIGSLVVLRHYRDNPLFNGLKGQIETKISSGGASTTRTGVLHECQRLYVVKLDSEQESVDISIQSQLQTTDFKINVVSENLEPRFLPGANIIILNHAANRALHGLKASVLKFQRNGKYLIDIDKQQDIDEPVRDQLEKFEKPYKCSLTMDAFALTFQRGDRVELQKFSTAREGDAAFNGQVGIVQRPHPTAPNKWYVVLDQGKDTKFGQLPEDFVKNSLIKNANGQSECVMSLRENKIKHRAS